MKFGTFSIVVGNKSCNAQCPFCVSKETGYKGIKAEFDERNLRSAVMLAKNGGVSTVLFTGKGEPSLYFDQVRYAMIYGKLAENFPMIELQTNGLNIQESIDVYAELANLGLTTVCLSIVHWENKRNQSIYCPNKEYPDLVNNIDVLHSLGLSVRLSCIGLERYVFTPTTLVELVRFAKDNEVEQLTWRPVWGSQTFALSEERQFKMVSFVRERAFKLLELGHGAEVFDFEGQNLCMTDCMTETTNKEEVRQLIYFPDGHLRYSWNYEGAIIL